MRVNANPGRPPRPTHPEPFHLDLGDFLSGPDGGEPDVDDVFAKSLEDALDEFRRFSPQDLLPTGPAVGSLIDPSFGHVPTDAGILLVGPDRGIAGFYLSCDLTLSDRARGRGLGMETVLERALRDGSLPTWHLDVPAYSRAGLAAHAAAWRHARGNRRETAMRMRRIDGGCRT